MTSCSIKIWGIINLWNFFFFNNFFLPKLKVIVCWLPDVLSQNINCPLLIPPPPLPMYMLTPCFSELRPSEVHSRGLYLSSSWGNQKWIRACIVSILLLILVQIGSITDVDVGNGRSLLFLINMLTISKHTNQQLTIH